MNIYKISQDVNNGYDTYDSAIVAAESEDQARNIHPANDDEYDGWEHNSWADNPEQVKVELIGITKEDTEQGVILASFNAG